ncbi:MAG: patatin-like phospholipase family protein [Ilumatobacteraceae bacterium]|nr:patatin-like phospholipase family protein [Ilumatobacteraceae bacterium]
MATSEPLERFDVDPSDVARAVAECGLFASVTDEALDELRNAFDGVRLTTGQTLMVEGEPAAELYIVRHGRLRATVVGPDGADVLVGEIGKSEVVGEMAVMTDQDRAATVRAMRDTDLFRLPAESFARLVQHHPAMLRPFASVVVDRLRTAMTQPARPSLPATIVLLPVDDDDLSTFAHQLAERLTDYETVVLGADDVVGVTHPAAWLLEIENRVQISLLIADRGPTAWTRLCLRHADRVNIVANDRASAELTETERDPACAARIAEVPTHLIMRTAGRPPTTEWIRRRTLVSHVNVSATDADDLARLARVMTGTSNVLVLGGGGARGFAHFGVARAFVEAGVPIDGIIGTSAGAVVGGLLARLGDPVDAQRQMLQWFEAARWRRDLTPPSVALMSGRTMTTGLQELGGGMNIEELPINFAAVSCDLVSARPFVHDRGPMWQALRASGSVPGLFPPLAVDGMLLVDGGLVANMPSEIARNRHPNARLIAVEVGDPTGLEVGGLDGSGILNGWDRLRRRNTAPGGASLSKLLMRLTELGRQDSTDHADVVITPDVRGYGLTDTKRAREIAERGYEAGRAAVAELAATA